MKPHRLWKITAVLLTQSMKILSFLSKTQTLTKQFRKWSLCNENFKLRNFFPFLNSFSITFYFFSSFLWVRNHQNQNYDWNKHTREEQLKLTKLWRMLFRIIFRIIEHFIDRKMLNDWHFARLVFTVYNSNIADNLMILRNKLRFKQRERNSNH